MSKKPMPATNVRLPEELLDKLRVEAEKRGVSQNTLMIESIRRCLIDLETEIYWRGFNDGYRSGQRDAINRLSWLENLAENDKYQLEDLRCKILAAFAAERELLEPAE